MMRSYMTPILDHRWSSLEHTRLNLAYKDIDTGSVPYDSDTQHVKQYIHNAMVAAGVYPISFVVTPYKDTWDMFTVKGTFDSHYVRVISEAAVQLELHRGYGLEIVVVNA